MPQRWRLLTSQGCLCIGILLFTTIVVSAAALSPPSSTSPLGAVTVSVPVPSVTIPAPLSPATEPEQIAWSTVAFALAALVMAVGGAYVTGFKGRIDKLEKRIETLNDALLGDYHDKNEAQAVIEAAIEPLNKTCDRMERSIEAVHRRLDAASFPARGPITQEQPAYPYTEPSYRSSSYQRQSEASYSYPRPPSAYPERKHDMHDTRGKHDHNDRSPVDPRPSVPPGEDEE